MDLGELSRRRLLEWGVGLGSVASAGWIGLAMSDPLDSAEPEVPEDELGENGWEKVDDTGETRAQDAGPITVTVETETLRYRDSELIGSIRSSEIVTEYRGEERRQPISNFRSAVFPDRVRLFSATRTDLSPDVDDLPGGLALTELLDRMGTQARAEFERELEAAGLEDVEMERTETFDVDTGEEATVHSYSAVYPFEEFVVGVRGEDVRLPGKNLDFAGHLAIWDHGEYVLLSGGVYPAQNYAETVTETDDLDREITASIDLGLDPDSYEDELRGLIEQVE